eukprot:g6031.t1
MFILAGDSNVEQYVILDSEFFGLYVKGRGERPAHLLYEISYIVINASGISSYTYYFQDLVLDGKVLEEKQVCYGRGAFRQVNKERLDGKKARPGVSKKLVKELKQTLFGEKSTMIIEHGWGTDTGKIKELFERFGVKWPECQIKNSILFFRNFLNTAGNKSSASMDDLTERFNAKNAIAEIIPKLTKNVKFFCGDYCPLSNFNEMLENQQQHNALYDTWATLLLLLYCWEKRNSLQKLKMADISLSFLTGLTKEEKRRKNNRRTLEYNNKRNQRPEIRAKNIDQQKNRRVKKRQKLAAGKEENTKIFKKYKNGQNGNLCFDSGKTALAAVSTGETVCIFNTDRPAGGIIFCNKKTWGLKKLLSKTKIKAAERFFSS